MFWFHEPDRKLDKIRTHTETSVCEQLILVSLTTESCRDLVQTVCTTRCEFMVMNGRFSETQICCSSPFETRLPLAFICN